VHLKNWNKRYFVFKNDYNIDYYDSEEVCLQFVPENSKFSFLCLFTCLPSILQPHYFLCLFILTRVFAQLATQLAKTGKEGKKRGTINLSGYLVFFYH
jgi:hypothetical protein